MRHLLRQLEEAANGEDWTVVSYVRLDRWDVPEFFLVARGRDRGVIVIGEGGAVVRPIWRGTDQRTARQVFQRTVAAEADGSGSGVLSVGRGEVAAAVTATVLDASAQARVRKALRGSTTWPTEYREPPIGEVVAQQLARWQGMARLLPVTRHRDWLNYHVAVVAAVRKRFGSAITLYRGVDGKQADQAQAGQDVAMRAYTSWTTQRRLARLFGPVIVQATFRPDDIILAPVRVQGSDQLMALEDEHEFIVELPGGVLPSGSYEVKKR